MKRKKLRRLNLGKQLIPFLDMVVVVLEHMVVVVVYPGVVDALRWLYIKIMEYQFSNTFTTRLSLTQFRRIRRIEAVEKACMS